MSGNTGVDCLGEAHVSLTAAVQTWVLSLVFPLVSPSRKKDQHRELLQGFGLVMGPKLMLFHSPSRSDPLQLPCLDGFWLQGQGLHVTLQKLFISNVGAQLPLPRSFLSPWRTSMCSEEGAPCFHHAGG